MLQRRLPRFSHSNGKSVYPPRVVEAHAAATPCPLRGCSAKARREHDARGCRLCRGRGTISAATARRLYREARPVRSGGWVDPLAGLE
jgi:hypothetical protein